MSRGDVLPDHYILKEIKMNRVVATFVIAVSFFAALGTVRLQLLMLETKTSEFILQSVIAILLADALYRNLKKPE